MPNGSEPDFTNLTSQELLEILDPNRDRPQVIPDVIEGTPGSALWDFMGQAVWKFADEAGVGSLGVSDIIAESIKGDKVVAQPAS